MTADVTYEGPPIDDRATLERIPADLRRVLEARNGYVAYNGGLHVRGACRAPAWHSLGYAWNGDGALHRLYPAVQPTDVPFAQDALGDQYLLRDGEVLWLAAESGELQSLGMGLSGFLDAIAKDAVGVLSLEPLLQFLRDGGRLDPGQLLNVYPPFIAAESRHGVSLRAIPAEERLAFLAELARAVADLPRGARFRIEMAE